MSKRNFVCALGAIFLTLSFPVEAQQPKKVPRIGYLSQFDAARESARAEAIQLALRERGHIEGQNIAFEYRYAAGKLDRFSELLAELVRLKVDIIVVGAGTTYVRAAKNATQTIPIVMVGLGGDPVAAGLIESLARPGGNVTGLTLLNREIGGKRLELLKEAVSKLVHVAVLYQKISSATLIEVKEVLPGRGARAAVDSSTLGGARCGRFRGGIRCDKQGAATRTFGPRRPVDES